MNVLKIDLFSNKINDRLPKFMKLDKIYHFCICFILSFLFGTHGVASAFSAGITKEYADFLNPQTNFSWGDILADFLGIIIGYPLGIYLLKGDFMLYFLYNLIY